MFSVSLEKIHSRRMHSIPVLVPVCPNTKQNKTKHLFPLSPGSSFSWCGGGVVGVVAGGCGVVCVFFF